MTSSRGWVDIRFAGPGEGVAARHLLEDELGGSYAALERALDRGELSNSYEVLDCVLVAAEGDQLRGVLVAAPSVNFVSEFPESLQHNVAAMVTKLSGIAVQEGARGRGLGRALVQRCLAEYRRRDYGWIYGQFDQSERLADFYRSLGFRIRGPGRTLVAPYLAGRAQFPATHPQEQWFDMILDERTETSAREYAEERLPPDSPQRRGAAFGL